MIAVWVLIISFSALAIFGINNLIFTILLNRKLRSLAEVTAGVGEDLEKVKNQLIRSLTSVSTRINDEVCQFRNSVEKKLESTHQGSAVRFDEQDKQLVDLKKRAAKVEEHMSIYRPVLESQQKLIAGVAEVAENLDIIRRRHR